MKVITVVGTRPELIRLSRIIYKLDISTEHILVHTGQNFDYELNKIFFDDLNIRKPNYFLNSAGNTAIETIGNIIISIDKILEAENPDALLILGDTNSCLCVIPAKRRKIPIFHMEAGNRCFDLRVPEEINRKIVDHTSDINLPYSSIAREYLIRENFPPDQIIKTGSPMFEVLNFYSENINKSEILTKYNLLKNKYFIVSIHREENVDSLDNLNKVTHILNNIAEKYNLPIILSTHPRTQKKLIEFKIILHPLINPVKPFGFFDYVNLQKNSFCVISDSGTITEEASILDFPAITLREVHERPEGMEEGAIIMSGLDVSNVISSINFITENRTNKIVNDYNVENVSDKILKIIFSYTSFINQKVWKKY
jgi:UDP-N-acetylglucosamine 2-epimerase (non-hydrolysing)